MTNGMKPGSGSDPFDDEPDEEDDVDEVEEAESADPDRDDTGRSAPWLFVRDGVKQSREHTFQLHLRSETRAREKRFQTAVEERLGEDVYKADLREAALLVAMGNEDDVVEKLREWGYDFGES